MLIIVMIPPILKYLNFTFIIPNQIKFVNITVVLVWKGLSISE